MITKHLQKIGNSRGIIFSPEMRQHLDNADELEMIYTEDGILFKKVYTVSPAVREAAHRALKKYPKTLKRLAE